MNHQKSKLELEAESFAQRLKNLDDSEQRYKDENWALETQTHELLSAAKDSTDREQRLQQALALTTSQKGAAQRELDDIKQAHGKLTEEHMTIRKTHEAELAGLRRNVNAGDSDRESLNRKIEELTSQNQELARAVAGRYREMEDIPSEQLNSGSEETALVQSDHEYSPPGSPSKGATRNSMLESETLKSSLHHAHRMIQNLKSNIHREKTEKLELKRMLQESRDELESRRSETGTNGNGNKRLKSRSQIDISKKAAKSGALGMGRNARTDIEIDENDWEDHASENSPKNVAISRSLGAASLTRPSKLTDVSDTYLTANETEDAFETANERDSTENEAFQTGNESFAGDSNDELTETEGGVARGGTVRGEKRVSSMITAKAGQRSSFISTASTSASEGEYEAKTPIQAQPQKYRLKVNRNPRRSRVGSEGPTSSEPSSMKNSPASFISNNGQSGGQSLFAELGDLNGDDSGEEMNGTPSRTSIASRRSTSVSSRTRSAQRSIVATEDTPVPRLPMVDSGMMTDLMEPTFPSDSLLGATSYIAPATPQAKDVGVQRTPAASPQQVTTSTSTSSTPRMAWDQPLQNFVSNIPTFWPAMASIGTSPKPTVSRDVQEESSPAVSDPVATSTPLVNSSTTTTEHSETPSTASKYATPVAPDLAFSQIQSLETKPVEPAPAIPVRGVRQSPAVQGSGTSGDASVPIKEEDDGLGKAGVLGSVLGWAKNKTQIAPQDAQEKAGEQPRTQITTQQSRTPFQEVPANIMQRDSASRSLPGISKKTISTEMADQGSQTILSSEQIDSALSSKTDSPVIPVPLGTQRSPAVMMKPLSDIGAAASPPLRQDVSQDSMRTASRPGSIREAAPLIKSGRRPSSSGSARAAAAAISMPPLPPDHRQAIAAAAQKSPIVDGTATIMGQTSMGPPMAPASAYRQSSNRPRTPSESRIQSPTSRHSNTPRARYSTARSQMSRRSSITSFASEIDASFNIRTDAMPYPQGLDAGADPRMIQAITQTMIGEYLWKYTRKAGREDMSDNRHRRFFWIHPYTRTLYWSEQDPSTAGRAQLKAKSVAIEGVRVVADDNPMPPGLHRKSIIILTPGRAVKFTASTGQRHETWFNSLSYLILRTGTSTAVYNDGLTAEDVAEFDPRNMNSARSRTSRVLHGSNVSLSSYNSRTASKVTSRNASPIRRQSAISKDRASRQLNASTSSRHSEAKHGSMSSRLSSYWRPGSVRGSFSSRQQGSDLGQGAIYDASVVHDSAEDLRQVIKKQEEDADRLENVRACCDGELHSQFLSLSRLLLLAGTKD